MHLIIPTPCQKNWDTMQPQDDGLFCTACSKVVVDFTQMSAREIATYFENRKNEEPCGRFTNLQIDTTHSAETKELIESVLKTNLTFFKKMAAVILLYFIVPLNAVAQTKKDSTANNSDSVVCITLGRPIRVNSFQPKNRPFPKLKPIAVTAPITPKPLKTGEPHAKQPR